MLKFKRAPNTNLRHIVQRVHKPPAFEQFHVFEQPRLRDCAMQLFDTRSAGNPRSVSAFVVQDVCCEHCCAFLVSIRMFVRVYEMPCRTMDMLLVAARAQYHLAPHSSKPTTEASMADNVDAAADRNVEMWKIKKLIKSLEAA